MQVDYRNNRCDMDKNWKEQQLNLLGSKDSIFKYIPEELGNILYCDTDNPNKVSLSVQEARKKRLLEVVFLLCCSLGIGDFFMIIIFGE